MLDVALGDIMLVLVEGLVFNQKTILTHTFVCTAVTGVQSPIGAQNDIIDKLKEGGTIDLVTPYAACLSTAWAATMISAQRIKAQRMRRTRLAQSAGGLAAQAETTNLAVALTFNSVLGSRGEVANKHIGPLGVGTADTMINNGVLTDAYNDLLEALGTTMLTSVTTNTGNATWVPCIVHRDPETGVINGNSPYDNFFCNRIVSSQRTRIVGKGV